MARKAYEPRGLQSQYLRGGAAGQGQWARVDGLPVTANPWFTPAARAEWEAGWREEDAARKARANGC